MKLPKLSSQSIIYLMMCGGGIVVFIMITILPYKKALRQMDQDIENIIASINEQKILQPIFKDLLKQIKAKETQALPVVPQSAIGRRDTGRLAAIFQEMARASRLQLSGFAPDLNTFVDNTGVLKVTVSVAGDFLDLRSFFLELARLPYLGHIEQVVVKTAKHGKKADFTLWMVQEI